MAWPSAAIMRPALSIDLTRVSQIMRRPSRKRQPELLAGNNPLTHLPPREKMMPSRDGRRPQRPSMFLLFKGLVAVHIVFGLVGLLSFWIPVFSRKGSSRHRFWGRIFARAILVAGGIAILLALCTLYDPVGTHPHIKDAAFVRSVFGVMMLQLGVLTVNLAWYGREVLKNKANPAGNRRGVNLYLQFFLAMAAIGCVAEGIRVGQPLIMAASVIGFATVGTNLMHMLNPAPPPKAWLREHVKGIVGAGISVYTAFFAFGAVRFMPEIALHPGLWAIPLTAGLGLILYHYWKIGQSGSHLGKLAAGE